MIHAIYLLHRITDLFITSLKNSTLRNYYKLNTPIRQYSLYFTLYVPRHISAVIKICHKIIRYIYCLIGAFGWFVINMVVLKSMKNAEY